MDPRVVGTIINVVALLGVLVLTAGLGGRILRGHSRRPRLLLPVLALVFVLSALALISFPLAFSGSADSEQQVEVDR